MKKLMLELTVLLAGLFLMLPSASLAVSASDVLNNPTCSLIGGAHGNISGCGSSDTNLDKNSAHNKSLFTQIVNALLFAAGAVSFIFIVIGGIRYITSSGDSARVQSAKDSVFYAIIGLVVTILAIPIADFVINKVAGG